MRLVAHCRMLSGMLVGACAPQGHVLGMYNLAMMHLAKEGGGCDTARELLKKVAGECTHTTSCMRTTCFLHAMTQAWGVG